MFFNANRNRTIRVGAHNRSGARNHNSTRIYAPDRIGIVGFHNQAFVIARPAEAHSPWLQERSQELHSRIGGTHTNITDGVRKSMELLRSTPQGALRRIWLLTDGYPNMEEHGIMGVVHQARQAHINVNTIGFGDAFDGALLQRIASATHNGKFVSVQSLRQLTNALVANANPLVHGSRRHHHHSETTVIAVDLSGSMHELMDGREKIDVVEQALMQLLMYKQQCFS